MPNDMARTHEEREECQEKGRMTVLVCLWDHRIQERIGRRSIATMHAKHNCTTQR